MYVLSLSLITILSLYKTFPSSTFSFITIIEKPVSFSLFNKEYCTGDEPLHFGNKEACIFKHPYFGIFNRILGSMCPYEKTKIKSGFIFLIFSISILDFRFIGML